MKIPLQLVLWTSAAVVSVGALGIVIQRQHREVQRRVAVQVATKPLNGSAVFRSKGCANCHGASGAGTSLGPSLRDSRSLTSLPRLVTTVWNHAPHMWQAMSARHLPYPTLSYEETSQLVTYLYISGYADNSGNIQRGEELFRERKCSDCHSRESSPGASAPSLLTISNANDPLAWTQALWNHAPAMQLKMRSNGMNWPKLQASDMRDLFTYVQHMRSTHDDLPDISGDPDRGWELFQQKGCIRCHEAWLQSGAGPTLAMDAQLPTFSEFGAAMLNHFPNMENAMELQKAELPRFENHDVADIAVFLYSLHYVEPTGSLPVGRSIFAWRSCSRCHGKDGQGSPSGPALRGRGHAYTAVRLASALWSHGARMYQTTQKNDEAWPTLQDSDIGHLLTFLNTAPEQ